MLKSRGFWIGIVVSLVFIGLFVRSTDFAKVQDAFASLDRGDYLLALLSMPVYFAGLLVRAARWSYLLRPVKRVSPLRLYPVVIVGLMANNLVPARAGELARAYVLSTRERISKTTSLGTIAVDRLFDGVTLVPIVLIVAALAGPDTQFAVGFGKNLSFAGLGLVMAALFGVALAILVYLALYDSGRRLLHQMVHRVAPERYKPGVEKLLHSFFEGLHALRSPLDLVAALVLSLVSWSLEATMYYMIGRAFGIDEGFHIFLLLTAAANLAIAIVASQGGVGPFEVVVSKTVVSFGAAAGVGEAYAIGLHAMLLFPIVVLGLYLMWSMKLTFGDMLKRSGAGDEPQPGDVRAARDERPPLIRPAAEGTPE